MHEGFVKYFLRLRSNGKEKREIFFNFRGPPITLHIHSSDRERMWPEAHCHVRDFRAIWTMANEEKEQAHARCGHGLRQGSSGNNEQEEEEGGDRCQHKCQRQGAPASEWAVEENDQDR